MNDVKQVGSVLGSTLTSKPMSRIENDIESMKLMTARLEATTERLIRHARNMGYFEPTPKDAGGASPVITTLADALRAMDRAVEHVSGSLNVFD